MDGCTMGDDSYFASKLIANILRKIGRECYYKEYLSGEMLHLSKQLKQICKRLFEELVFLKNHLQLEVNELLSTVVLGVVDIEKKTAEIIVIGDGVIVYKTLLHYPYPISKIGWDRYLQAINSGRLHPKDFAYLYIFERNKTSVLYKYYADRPFQLPDYYFNLPYGYTPKDVEKANQDRDAFGMCSLEVERKKDDICRKYDIRLW